MRFLQEESLLKSYRIWGLHGFLGLPTDWKQYNFIAPVINKASSLESWAKDFNNTVDSVPHKKNILVGYSLGGRLALHAALDQPGLWDQVVLVSTHLGLERGHRERLSHDSVWAERFRNDEWETVVNEWNSQSVFESSLEFSRLEKDFDRELLASYLTYFSLGSQKKISSLPVNIHHLVGEKDGQYRALYPDAEVITDAGHRVHLDNPAALKKFIERICNTD